MGVFNIRCAAAVLVLATLALADPIRYEYEGEPFTVNQSLYPGDGRFTGYILVDIGNKPIENAAFSQNNLLEFSFTDGDRTFWRGNVGSANMHFETDERGDIDRWALSFGESVFRFRISNFYWYFPVGDESYINVGYGLRASTTTPGSWTRAGVTGPDAQPVPEPGTALLLALAAGLGFMARARRARR